MNSLFNRDSGTSPEDPPVQVSTATHPVLGTAHHGMHTLKLFTKKKSTKEAAFEGCAGVGKYYNVERKENPKPRVDAVSLAGVVIFNKEIPKNVIDMQGQARDGVAAAGRGSGVRFRRRGWEEAEQPSKPDMVVDSKEVQSPGPAPSQTSEGKLSPKASSMKSCSGCSSTTASSPDGVKGKVVAPRKGSRGTPAPSQASRASVSGSQADMPRWR